MTIFSLFRRVAINLWIIHCLFIVSVARFRLGSLLLPVQQVRVVDSGLRVFKIEVCDVLSIHDDILGLSASVEASAKFIGESGTTPKQNATGYVLLGIGNSDKLSKMRYNKASNGQK